MAIGNWPARFRAPLRSDYGLRLPDLNVRTGFALGARVRPLFADGPDTIPATVLLSYADWDYFQGWYRHELANGANWFNVPLLAAGEVSTREARIVSPPTFSTLTTTHIRVQLELETREGTTMSLAAWNAPP